MRRLTTKSKNIEDMYLCDIHNVQEAIDRLGKFEDIMEEYNIKVLRDIPDVFTMFKSSMNEIRQLLDENKALKYKWDKLKEIISNKQHIKGKTTDFVTLLGASGVEVFCEMLLKEMQKLEEQN